MAGEKLALSSVRCALQPDGSILVENTNPLGAYSRNAADNLVRWASRDADRLALADRKGDPSEWRRITYGELADQSARFGQFLLDSGAGPERPVVLISENRIEAAVVMFAAYRAGVPVAPITPAYTSGSGDSNRVAAIFEVLRPAVVVVDQASHLKVLHPFLGDGFPMVCFGEAAEWLGFAECILHPPGQALFDAEKAVDGDTIAKILFTSGSTGTPKGAINTHRMLASNVQAIRQGWTFLEDNPPILADWLPWNHTFGGNYVLNSVTSTGGTLYIDDGRPMPNAIRRSVENNAEIRPTVYFNAPRGLDMAARILAEDNELATRFFERLGLIFFASAGLPKRIRDDWQVLIDRHAHGTINFVSAWGTTETGPLATALNFDAPEINNIGNPVPGTTLKLAPVDGRFELRVKGPNITPGYLNRPDLTQGAFDEQGFFKTGDVGRLASEDNPQAGILIEGRLAEDFKLSTGVWVNVAGIRGNLLELFGPVVRDVVLSGPDKAALAALIFLDVEQCCRRFNITGDAAATAKAEAVRDYVRDVLDRYNDKNPGTSRRIGAHKIMGRLLEPQAGEVTEKGTVNQSVVLRREAVLCEALSTGISIP